MTLSRPIKPTGYNADTPADELGPQFVTSVRNVHTENGQLEQADPYEQVFGTPLNPVRYMIPNQDEDTAYWLYAGGGEVGVTDGATHWDITPTGLLDESLITQPYSGGIVNQRPVLNSRQDGPFWWDQATANPMQALPDWPAGDLCESMRSFRGFLIAMNVFRSGSRLVDLVKWSDVAAPGDIPRSWTEGTDSQAGEGSVSFNPGALVDGRQLLDRFYLYKTSSVYLLQLVGGALVFNQRPVFAEFGALSRGCIEGWRGRHIVLTDGDLLMHDGLNVESLAEQSLRKEIFDNLDGTNFENSYVAMQKDLNRLYICRPRPGEVYPTEALVLNLKTRTWGHQELPAVGAPHLVEGLVDVGTSNGFESTWDQKTTTWATDPTRWNSAAFARTANFMLVSDNAIMSQLGSGNSLGGTSLDATIERVGLHMGEPSRKKNCDRLWPKIDGATGGTIMVSVGSHDDAEAPPVYGPEVPFTIGLTKSVPIKDVQDGCYLAYRFRSTGALRWRLRSLQMNVQLKGRF